MLTNVTNIDFNDMSEAIPLLCMHHRNAILSTASPKGISMGVITYVALNLITGKAKRKKGKSAYSCTYWQYCLY